MSSFIQIMQLQTSKIDEIRAAVDEWQKATEGKRTVGRSAVCRGPAGQPGPHAVVVFFDSYEDAMKNCGAPRDRRTLEEDDGPV